MRGIRNIYARQMVDALDSRYDRRKQVSFDAYIETVTRDENGQAVSATATVDGVSGVPVQIPYGAKIAPGSRFFAVNYGSYASPNWVLGGAMAAAGAPRVYEFTETTTLNGTTYSPDDALFGDPADASMWYQVSTGQLHLRAAGDTVILLDAPNKLFRVGSLSDNYMEYDANAGTLTIKGSITAESGYITGDMVITGDGVLRVLNPLGPSIEISEDGIIARDAANFPFFTIGTYVDSTTGEPRSYAHFGPWDSGIHVTWDDTTQSYVTNVPADIVVGDLSGITIETEQYIRVGSGNYSVTLSGQDATYRLWAGSQTASSAPFRVSGIGHLVATDATVTGNITATTIDVKSGNVTGTLVIGPNSSDAIMIEGGLKRMRSTDYEEGKAGFLIDGDGDVEFNNAIIRGELHATVLRQDYEIVAGGNTIFTNSTILSMDMDTTTTFMYVKDRVLSTNDIIKLQARGNIEYMKVTSGPVSVKPSQINEWVWQYTVQRDLDGSGANEWIRGDGVKSEGQSGYGWLEVVSGVAPAPYLDVVYRSGTGVTDTETKVRIGNLDGVSDDDLNPTGFGMYGTNIYLRGKFVAEGGIVEQLTITGSSGESALIVGGNGTIRSLDAGYTQSASVSLANRPTGSGFWFGRDEVESGNPYVAYIGDRANNKYLFWDGTDFNVRGSIIADSGEFYNVSVKGTMVVEDKIATGTSGARIELTDTEFAGYNADGQREILIPTSGPNAGQIMSGDGTLIIGRRGIEVPGLHMHYVLRDSSGNRFVYDQGGAKLIGQAQGSYVWNPNGMWMRYGNGLNSGRIYIPDDSGLLTFQNGDHFSIQAIVRPLSRKRTLLFNKGYINHKVYSYTYTSPHMERELHVNCCVYIDDSGNFIFEYASGSGGTGDWNRWTSSTAVVTDLNVWYAISFRYVYGQSSYTDSSSSEVSPQLVVWNSSTSTATTVSGSWNSGGGSGSPRSPGRTYAYIGAEYGNRIELYENDKYQSGEDGKPRYDDSGSEDPLASAAIFHEVRIWRVLVSDDQMNDYRY